MILQHMTDHLLQVRNNIQLEGAGEGQAISSTGVE
jgi:hypothetical protein